MEEAEIVVLDATEISDQESDESDVGWMCAICLAIFETEEQWSNHQDFGTCSATNTPEKPKKKYRRAKRYCRTCRTLFNSERSNDLHEPCPERGRESETGTIMAVTVRVAEKSRDTKSTIDQILCRYCREHCEASIHDPR